MSSLAQNGIGFRNRLLRGLPADEVAALNGHLHHVPLVLRQVLHAEGAPIHDVYFIEDGLTSLTAAAGDGAEVEVGLTGREGMVGLAVLLMDDATAVHRSFMQIPGSAWRMQSSVLRELIPRCPVLRDRAMRYVQFMLVQAAQTAACNARHGLPERLARWLLLSMDRTGEDEIPITQEFLSYMLGVRRAGVSVVANDLQEAGLIRQARGRVTLLDRAGLEARACSCYRTLNESKAKIMDRAP